MIMTHDRNGYMSHVIWYINISHLTFIMITVAYQYHISWSCTVV